jgi:CBS domain-containing protein
MKSTETSSDVAAMPSWVRGGDMSVSAIMTSRGTKALTEEVQKSLASRLTQEGAAETLELLYSLRDELRREMSAGKGAAEEIGKLISGMEEIRLVDELQEYSERFERLLAQQFASRSSVREVHELSCSFYEKLVSTALSFAMHQLRQEGRTLPDIPFALLVSGELGRREAVVGERSSFFFVFQDCGLEERKCYDELALRFMAALSVRFPTISRNMFKEGNLFWSGSRSEWEEHVLASLKGGDGASRLSAGESGELLFSRMFAIAADLRPLSGDALFSESLLKRVRKILAEEVSGDRFWHMAKNIAAMPLALTMFGRLKTERSGRHRGEFSIKSLAVDPLVASSRALAVALGIEETSTVERLKGVLASGNLGVALADRLLVAYQDFLRQLISIELDKGSDPDRLYLNPDSLDSASRERLKCGLEEISTLQRFVHQQLVEVEQ